MVRSDPVLVVAVPEVVERSVRFSSSSNGSAEASVEETRGECRLRVEVDIHRRDRDEWFHRCAVSIRAEGTRISADAIRS